MIEDIEDFYTFYVQILGISEDLFWNADYTFVASVADNKRAYDAWLNCAQEDAREESRRRK